MAPSGDDTQDVDRGLTRPEPARQGALGEVQQLLGAFGDLAEILHGPGLAPGAGDPAVGDDPALALWALHEELADFGRQERDRHRVILARDGPALVERRVGSGGVAPAAEELGD